MNTAKKPEISGFFFILYQNNIILVYVSTQTSAIGMKILKLLLYILFFIGASKVWAQQPLKYNTTDKYYFNALELFQNKQYAAAEQLFDNYLSHTEVNKRSTLAIDAEYYSAICDLYLYHSNAETRISEFAKNYPQHPKTTKANYDLATFYYHDKKFAKAITFFEKVSPKSLDKKELVDYKFKLAYCYLMEKNYSKAALFNDIKNVEGDYKTTATYYAGFVNYKNGNYPTAETDIKSLLDNKELGDVVPALYLNILCKQKKYTEAIAYVNNLDAKGAKYKQPDDVNLLTGEAYFQTKDYKNAVSRFEKVSNIQKAQADTAFKYGYALYDQQLYARSVDVFKNITAKNLTGQYAAYYLGLSYLKLDNKQFALNSFVQASDMNFDSSNVKPKALFYQGKVNFDLRNFEDAIVVLKRFTQRHPKHEYVDEANSLLSEAFLNSSNYQEAIKYIENLPRKTDRAAAAYQKVTFYKAMELFNDNKIDLSLEFLDKSLENKKTVSFTQKALFWRAEGLSILKMYPDAYESYMAIPKGDDYLTTKSYYGIAYTQYFQKKYDNALKYFKEYAANHKKVDNKPNYIDALIRIADCQYVSKKYEDALQSYDKALAENPSSDIDYILFQKGSVYEILENYPEALQNYELLIRRYPNSVYYDNALFQKGNIEYVKNNFEGSIKVFNTLINEKPDSKVLPTAYLLRGKSYKNTEKVEQSIPDFQKIIDEYPNSGIVKDAILELQESYSRLGKEAEFDKVMEEFDSENPQHSDMEKIQYQTAFNAYNSHKTDLAITKLKSFMEKHPNSTYNPDVEYFIGNAYMQKNDSTNAALYYNKVIDNNKSEYVIDAVATLAKIELGKNNLSRSNALYHRLLQMSTNQNEILLAQVGLMDNYYKTQKYDSTLIFSKQILKSGSKNVNIVNRAGLVQGISHLAIKDTMAALTQFMDMLNTTQDEFGAEANYRAAEIFYQTKQYKQSIDKIYYLKEKYKNYKEWYQKSFLLLTDNYVAMNEIFQAKAILKSIISKSKEKDFVEKAKAKLAYIEANYKNEEEEEE